MIIVPPERPNFILAADIPDREIQVVVFYRLNVEPYGVKIVKT